MAVETKKVQFTQLVVKDITGWLLPNMFISSQMMISTDADRNFCMEAFRFLPES